MKSSIRVTFASALIASLFAAASVQAQGTAFTYQGLLDVAGAPANGNYDLTFQLFSAATNGTAGPIVTKLNTPVTNGLFTATLDYGPGVFPGSNNWVQIAARAAGSSTFTNLSPLLPITPTPYALAAATAATASNALTASALSGAINSGNLSGAYTNGVTFNNSSNIFVGDGAGLSNLPAATLSGVYTNAVTFSNASNIFVGDGAGLSNVVAASLSGGISSISSNALNLTNTANVFVGNGAGLSNVTVANSGLGGVYTNTIVLSSTNNVFVGDGSGLSNVTALALSGNIVPVTLTNTSNVFVGDGSGLSNVAATVITGAVALDLTNTGNLYYGNGVGLSNVTASALSGTVSNASLSGAYTGSVSISNAADTFGGDGSGLTNLNASALTTGTVPLAAVNAAVLTNNEASAVSLSTNLSVGGNLAVTGQLSGDGGGLTNLIGAPLYGSVNLTFGTGATVYCPLTVGGTNFNLTNAAATNNFNFVAPRDETVSHLTFSSSVAFAPGTFYAFSFLTNGGSTGMSATIVGNGATQVAFDFTHVIFVPAGTQEMVSITGSAASGGPVYFNWSMLVK